MAHVNISFNSEGKECCEMDMLFYLVVDAADKVGSDSEQKSLILEEISEQCRDHFHLYLHCLHQSDAFG